MAGEENREGTVPAAEESGGDPRIGQVLQGRYRIHKRIASGGMGAVYQGERLGLGRPVAIKFLHAALARDPQVMKRFEVEAQAMSKLAHPNCIAVTDFGVDELPYLVMDFVQGSPLRTILEEEGLLGPRRAIKIARQLLAALGHAHALGVVHRDMKPENVVIESRPGLSDHARILDFGLAKLLGNDSALTMGMAVGTPNYMAPEQTREGPVDGRADLYAVGIVLFEMLTGSKPFDATEVGEVFLRQIAMPPPKLRSFRPHSGFSAEIEAVVLKAMAKAPQDRFASADEMSAALEGVPEASLTPAPAVGAAGVQPAELPDATIRQTPASIRALTTPSPSAVAKTTVGFRLRRFFDGHPLRTAAVAAAGSALLVLLVAALWPGRRPAPVEASRPAAHQSSPAALPSARRARAPERASSRTAAAPASSRSTSAPAKAPAVKRSKAPATRSRVRDGDRPRPAPARKRPFLQLL